jgi:hypothetical protein
MIAAFRLPFRAHLDAGRHGVRRLSCALAGAMPGRDSCIARHTGGARARECAFWVVVRDADNTTVGLCVSCLDDDGMRACGMCGER